MKVGGLYTIIIGPEEVEEVEEEEDEDDRAEKYHKDVQALENIDGRISPKAFTFK